MKPIHQVPPPFPWRTRGGRTIVDEKCECGHRRSWHLDRATAFGHGPCTNRRCRCVKYTYKEAVVRGQRREGWEEGPDAA